MRQRLLYLVPWRDQGLRTWVPERKGNTLSAHHHAHVNVKERVHRQTNFRAEARQIALEALLHANVDGHGTHSRSALTICRDLIIEPHCIRCQVI